MEGKYYEQELEPRIDDDGMHLGDYRSGQHEVYYIPFNKKAVDEIVEAVDKGYLAYAAMDYKSVLSIFHIS